MLAKAKEQSIAMLISVFVPIFKFKISFRCEQDEAFCFLTAGSDLVGRRNVGKSKRTKYCDADKAYFSSIALILLTPLEEDCSLTILNLPKSPVCLACGPPQISLLNSPIV